MGKIKDFNKIEFTPFSYRIGDLEARNFYTNRTTGDQWGFDGKQKLSTYQIVKWRKNEYFGNEKDYILRGDYYQKKSDSNWSHKLHKSCFESPETCLVIAQWVDMDNDERKPNLEFVGSRPFDLESQTEMLVFMELAKATQYRIQSELRSFNTDYEL